MSDDSLGVSLNQTHSNSQLCVANKAGWVGRSSARISLLTPRLQESSLYGQGQLSEGRLPLAYQQLAQLARVLHEDRQVIRLAASKLCGNLRWLTSFDVTNGDY